MPASDTTTTATVFTDTRVDWLREHTVERLSLFYTAYTDSDKVTPSVIMPTSDQYNLATRTAFEFVRRHGDGRYSDRTLMATHRLGDRWARTPSLDVTEFPPFVVVEEAASYDPDTEVKSGGIIGMAYALPSEYEGGTRAVLAVRQQSRCKGLGRYLLAELGVYLSSTPALFVGRTNTVGLMFALANEYLVEGMNQRTGTLELRHRYSGDSSSVEPEERYPHPLSFTSDEPEPEYDPYYDE